VLLFLYSPDDDDEVPLAKKEKLFSKRTKSARQSNPSATEVTPPRRTVVAKVPVSTVNPSAGAPAPSTARDHVSESIQLDILD
jgi:hypothetical protein